MPNPVKITVKFVMEPVQETLDRGKTTIDSLFDADCTIETDANMDVYSIAQSDHYSEEVLRQIENVSMRLLKGKPN